MTIITRLDCPKQSQRRDDECRPVRGNVVHRKASYRVMMYGLRLWLDREPTNSEIYAYLCEVQRG